MTKQIKAVIKNDALVVVIPLSLMKFAFENNPDLGLKIKNRQKMAQWMKKHILEFTNTPGNSERGLSDLEDLLDRMAIEALESGEDWIECPELELEVTE